MSAKTSTRAIRLDTALWDVAVFRRQQMEFLNSIESSVRNHAFWTLHRHGFAYQWDMETLLAVVYHMFNFTPYSVPSGPFGPSGHNDRPEPVDFWVQDATGQAFHRVFTDALHGLRNNLEAHCMGQTKLRKKGIFRGEDYANRFRIRVPHR